MATSNYGVVAVIQPPMLKSVDQPALTKFETAFSAYRSTVEDVNKKRNERTKLSMATVKNCIDPYVLHGLCVMGDIDGAPTLEEATAEKVQAWFDNASSSSPKDLSERINATLRAVSFKPNKEDPAGGVSNFMITVITSLDQNNASEILKDADMAKKFLNRLVSKFQPDVLQERIKMMRRGWKKEQLASIKLFRDEVSNIALELSLTETARARVNPRKLKQNRDRSRKQNEPSTLERSSPKEPRASSKTGRNGSKRKDAEWSQPCLNEECNGIHHLKDCPITPPEKMKEIFERHYANKKSKKAKSLKTEQKGNDLEPDGEKSRFRVCLEDTVFDTVLGDSGADFSAIDPNVLERIISAVPELRVTEFPKPLSLEIAFKPDGNVKFTASRSLTLNITIYLPGSNIPVRVRGVEFYVVDHDMGEILLGRPFLHSIGFNLNDHLHRVREEIHDRNLREIDSESLKLSSVRYRGLSYMAADDDPIELPEYLAAGIGNDTKNR